MNPQVAEQWISVLKTAIAAMAPVVGGIWFVIKRYGAMLEKIKRLQAEAVLTSVNALKDQLAESKTKIEALDSTMGKTREDLARIAGRMEMNTRDQSKVITAIKHVHEAADLRLKLMESTLAGGEIKAIGDRVFKWIPKKP